MATKKQKSRISRLGAEWAVLDSEENVVNRLIREHHRASRPDVEKGRSLKVLQLHQRKLSKRKREISDEIAAIENGISISKKRLKGRRPAFNYPQVR
jgi:hypothetical protein